MIKGIRMAQIEPVDNKPIGGQRKENHEPKRKYKKRVRLPPIGVTNAPVQPAQSKDEQKPDNPEPEAQSSTETEEPTAAPQSEGEKKPADYWEKQLAQGPAKDQAPAPSPNAAKKKPMGLGLIDRLQANVDEALGVQPQHPVNTASVQQPSAPVQAQQTVAHRPAAAPISEIGAVKGGSLGSSPFASSALAMIGLIVALVGTYLHSVVGVGAEIIGLVVFVFGAVYIIKYIRRTKGMHSV